MPASFKSVTKPLGMRSIERAIRAGLILVCVLLAGRMTTASAASAVAPAMSRSQITSLKITVLVTNLAGDVDEGQGEWGYSALIEVDGHKILYDTGASPGLVLSNAERLGISLADVEHVVLSHNHRDHVGGLLSLRRELMKTNPRAMSRAHVASEIFEPRLDANGVDRNGLKEIRAQYTAMGAEFVPHDRPSQLLPGVWFTAAVPRVTQEKNWSRGLRIKSATGTVDDTVPEDAALIFDTQDGLVILTACGHAGVVNIAEYARKLLGSQSILAIVGGLHLFAASDDTVLWTGGRLRSFGLRYLLAGHCTGIEATFRLRQILGLDRKTAVVSAVGSSFTLGKGIDARELAG